MANFIKELPKWEADGIQPPDNLLKDGWKASQRPPADYFNWFFSRTYYALKELQDSAAKDSDLVAHERLKNNPHDVTATQVGLGNVINQKQATKVEFDTHNEDAIRHILQSERDNWNSKAPGVHTHQWADVLGVPIAGLSQKGIVQLLDSVTSTEKAMAATPNAVKSAYDRGSTGMVDAAAAKKISEDHIATKNNPHGTTKAHVGLGSVQDYGVASTTEAQVGSLNNRYMTPFLVNEAIKSLQAIKSVNGRTGDVVLSKGDVGLGNVDNAKQATKTEFDAHSSSKSNPHGVTAAQVGAYTKAETDSKVSSAQNGVQANLNAHTSNTSNPHATTKVHVGLGSVDNVQQATKTEFNSHVTNRANPHGVTASQLGAYTKAETNVELDKHLFYADNRADNQQPIWYMTNWSRRTRYEFKTATSIGSPPFSMNGYVLLETKVVWSHASGGYPVQVAYAANGNGSAFRYGTSDTTWSAWLANETTAGAQAKATAVQSNLNSHTNNTANPHGTTKVHVGLGSVDNIQQATKAEFNTHNSDATRHMTAAERSIWNGKLNATANAVSATKLATARTIAGVSFDGSVNIAIPAGNVGAYTKAETDTKDATVQTNLNVHVNNKSNPHGVTAAQVGSYTKTESDSKIAASVPGLATQTVNGLLSAADKKRVDDFFSLSSGETLWSGLSTMNTDHSITPSKPLSKCLNGWIIYWSTFTETAYADQMLKSVIYKSDIKLSYGAKAYVDMFMNARSVKTVFKGYRVTDTIIRGQSYNVAGDNLALAAFRVESF